MSTSEISRTRWGRSRFGGGQTALLGAACGIGLLVSGILAWTFSVVSGVERPLLAIALVMLCTLPANAALGWALLVDRSTLRGAVERPDDSIETAWYQRAAAGAFGDLLLVGGLSAAAFAVLQIEAAVSWIIAAVVLFAMLDSGARFLWLRRAS